MGCAPAPDAVFTAYAQSLIKHKARQLVQRTDFNSSDEVDLAQEMRLHVLRRVHHFDPTRASYDTFIARIIDSWIATLLRDRRRHKRAAKLNMKSLEGTRLVHEGASTCLRDVLQPAQGLGHPDVAPDNEAARRELIAAVAQIVASLPEELGNICRRLPNQSRLAIQGDLGPSRRQFDNAITRIRKCFENAHIRNF